MRKLLWMLIFLGGYVWVVTSEHDEFILRQGKMIYQALVHWFEDAEIDFQLKKEKVSSKKRSRRWD